MTFRVMLASFRYLTLAAGMVSACHSQERWDRLDFKTANIGGVRLYGISVYSGYSNFSGPIATTEQTLVPANPGDLNYGAQWTAGWRHQNGAAYFAGTVTTARQANAVLKLRPTIKVPTTKAFGIRRYRTS